MLINRTLIVLVSLVLFHSQYAFSYGQHSLLGISGVAVFVENLSNEISDEELFVSELEEVISKKIKNSGVVVYKKSEWLNKAGGAYLNIKIISSKSKKNNSYAIYINYEFYRTVMFMSNVMGKTEVANAETWSTGKLMSCEKSNISECVYSGISELTDIFIGQYIDVNKIEKKKKK